MNEKITEEELKILKTYLGINGTANDERIKSFAVSQKESFQKENGIDVRVPEDEDYESYIALVATFIAPEILGTYAQNTQYWTNANTKRNNFIMLDYNKSLEVENDSTT